jgi:hypothetical protein
MQETHAPATGAETADEPLFSATEIRNFDAEDVEAGKNLCKMLSLFFVYTVLAMGAMIFFTYLFLMN